MKSLLKIIAIFVVVFFGSLFLIAWLFIGDIPGCGKDSEAAAYARSLSPQRLEKLYRDMEAYSVRDDLPMDGYYAYRDGESVPEVFNDLKVAKIRPSEGNIMVEGCMDEYVFLYFKGKAWRGGKDEITLSYPAHTTRPYEQKVEVLWSK